VYTPGKDNGRADALSRRHDIAGIKTIEEGAILKITRTSLALEQSTGNHGSSAPQDNFMMSDSYRFFASRFPSQDLMMTAIGGGSVSSMMYHGARALAPSQVVPSQAFQVAEAGFHNGHNDRLFRHWWVCRMSTRI
jgi:hypothetical protein